jgi:hypothetical protein
MNTQTNNHKIWPARARRFAYTLFRLLWGLLAIYLTAAATFLCVVFLFVPPVVLLLPVCVDGLKVSWRVVMDTLAPPSAHIRSHARPAYAAHAAL